MKKNLLLSSLLAAGSLAMAQDSYTHQYFFTSGGDYGIPDNKVSVGYLKNNHVEYIDHIKGDFSNAVNVYHNETSNRYEGIAHIGRGSGKDLLVRYNLDTYRVIDSTVSSGVVAVARNASKIVVAKGYGSKGAKVDILAANFDSLTSFYAIKNDCKSVKIFGDYAYISHSDSVGRISVIDLTTNTLTNTFDLGKKAKGISNLIVSPGPANSVALYFSGGTDSIYQYVNTFIYSKKDLNVLGVTKDKVLGVELTFPTLTLVSIDKTTMAQDKKTGPSNSGDFKWFFSGNYDTLNNDFVILRSRYAAPSSLIRTDGVSSVDSFSVKTSASAVEIDYRPLITTALFASSTSSVSFKAFPNPCREVLTVQTSSANAGTAQIVSVDGRIVASHEVAGLGEFRIPTSDLEKGIYTLRLKGEKGIETVKFIKE